MKGMIMERTEKTMRRLLAGLALLLSPVAAMAQTDMRDVWVQMPDSVVAYLDKGSRTEMADFYQMKVKASSKNLLDGYSVIDTLTSDYIHVTLNGNTMMEMKILPAESSFVICVIKTYTAPEAESEVSFFNQSWQPIRSDFGLPSMGDAEALKREFAIRPDTITQERFDELFALLDPVMVSADVSSDENIITLRLSRPLLSEEDKLNINAIFKPRKFKWNGRIFIEC